MPDDGLGIGMLVVGVGVDHAILEQMAEASFAEALDIATEQVAA